MTAFIVIILLCAIPVALIGAAMCEVIKQRRIIARLEAAHLARLARLRR